VLHLDLDSVESVMAESTPKGSLASESASKRSTLSSDRERTLGSTQEARSLTQSSDDRESATAGLQHKEDGMNKLKRRSTGDTDSDYPRRRARATIAVCFPSSG
jgi:hypothetical protein